MCGLTVWQGDVSVAAPDLCSNCAVLGNILTVMCCAWQHVQALYGTDFFFPLGAGVSMTFLC